jgi:peptide/nickel transport system permease protein
MKARAHDEAATTGDGLIPENRGAVGLDVDKQVDESARYLGLLWSGFRRNGLALGGLAFLLVLALCSIFAPFVAPNSEIARQSSRKYAPPEPLHFLDSKRHLHAPFVYDLTSERDELSGKITYKENIAKIMPVRLLVRSSSPSMLFGFVPLGVRLFGVESGLWYPFGGDLQGRCLFSRIIYASRISLAIAVLGALFTVVLGTAIGTISGYRGGALDMILQRIIEVTIAFPRIPLWMALAASLPVSWTPLDQFFLISVVLSILGWGGLARQIRGLVLSLRENDYVMAAKSYGASNARIMYRHILPNVLSVTIVNATILIPIMILGETALSFLGLGLRPPINSWGVLLQDAQSVQAMQSYIWLLIPGAFVILSILAFNFIGDGLRDSIDPYKTQG